MLLKTIASVMLFQAVAWAATNEDCPQSFPRNQYTKVFGDKCYRFVINDAMEYENAEEYCETLGGTLAIANTKAIDGFLYESLASLFYHGEAWIGLDDQVVENDYVWKDGSPLKYTNWKDKNEGPRDGLYSHYQEDCVAIDMASGGKWKDFRCEDQFLVVNEHKEFVCEGQADITTIPPTTPTTTQGSAPVGTTKTPAVRPTVAPVGTTKAKPVGTTKAKPVRSTAAPVVTTKSAPVVTTKAKPVGTTKAKPVGTTKAKSVTTAGSNTVG